MVSRTKLVLLVFALLLTLLAFSFSSSPTKIVIDSKTSATELADMQRHMELKGYMLNITEMTRDENGNIKGIRGEVQFGKDLAGSFETDDLFGKIVITQKKSGLQIEVNKLL